MRFVFSYPGNMSHAQQCGRALAEAGALQVFVTSFVYRDTGPIAAALKHAPFAGAQRLHRELLRRTMEEVPAHLIRAYPWGEIARTLVQKAGRDPIATDKAWDRMSRHFDALVARRHVPHAQAVCAFEYTAHATFEAAGRLGVAKILQLPSLDSRHFEELQRREKAAWPELNTPHDGYFDTMFDQRYERRQQEIAAADIIIANSTLTARSHIAAGAAAEKVYAVPLAAPAPIAEVREEPGRGGRPLRVLWAGSFSLGKGAHYLIDAWFRLKAGRTASLDVYGAPLLPERLLCTLPDNITFHGSVPRPVLYEAYQHADILVFPTLSDGFGLVVGEALAHGLPVITTDQAGAADLVTPEAGLVIPAADPQALCEALRWSLDNRERLVEMRRAALDAARRRQWSHFRADLRAALEQGLRHAGYTPDFKPVAETTWAA